MASPATLSAEECQVILQRWQADGVTPEEREDFVNRALQLFTDGQQVKGFADEMGDLAKLALAVYHTFDDVMLTWLNPSLIGAWAALKFVSYAPVSDRFT